MLLQIEREKEVARLKEERHQGRELKRKEEYVKQCRLDIEKRRLEVSSLSGLIACLSYLRFCAKQVHTSLPHHKLVPYCWPRKRI